MRSICLTLSLVLFGGTNASANVFDIFEDLQPVNSFLPDCVPSMNLGCDTCYTDSTCENSCYGCPPAPLMIGDSMGIPYHVQDGAGRLNLPNFYSKVADNNSAIPQDRVFLTYQYFNDYRLQNIFGGPNSKRDLQLYTVGLEKTFGGGNLSAELIVPFSYSPSPQFVWGAGIAPASQMELQDVAFGLKALLYQNDASAVSTGVRLEVPTAADIHAVNIAGVLHNDVWAITPYLALLHNLTDDTFLQAFAAYRMRTTDQWVTSAGAPFQVGREPNYLNLDAQLGHWLYRNHGSSGLTGLMASVELHYTGTFEPVSPQGITGASVYLEGEQDILNLTTGITALFNDNATLTVGVVRPVRNGSTTLPGVIDAPSDRFYDWEAVIQFNYFFGN
ncbi:MAG TPA: hypothetical protein VMM56_00360 [Planctomycetaceae bacterium]|nr:hypothetical protein [Planctomycetaceae bacterium]